jgi:hypothetical protein
MLAFWILSRMSVKILGTLVEGSRIFAPKNRTSNPKTTF